MQILNLTVNFIIMSDDDGFCFLDQPALAAAATPESAPHVVDEFNTLMKEARC